ncbi:hypothetical protein U8D42_12735 [Mycobacterium europaeum]|uniref:hypothetical protein n=1 Tax=Mycobacterium europaeum TaxID=761804 RepID=UPI002ADF3159|nr:hypothetical protein [Mycobacterium europaeum]MEA1160668.1 hypothetical protein [Mycobacterium europaeum]
MAAPIPPDCPIPAGAVAGDWFDVGDPDAHRMLTWSRHDVIQVRITVEGTQYVDGRVERRVTLYPNSSDVDLTAAGARQLAAALLNAADALDML